ncbi:helix-turn-helix transcriptional regulator [Natronococcus roseus]|uniref:helix-turn-helix transcriptional regulator n=1 Tax=Natronococcus roseus TaxID=1052014 RepID=UPI00374DB1BB
MVFNTLWTRLSSLWSKESADTDDADTGAETETEPTEEQRNETLSYAEQIEYGTDDRQLPDDDKVLRLLVKRGGRVDESTVLEETNWSEEHLREVVEQMEDDDQVSAITVGQKRVICRRGFEPKGYRSHLNE